MHGWRDKTLQNSEDKAEFLERIAYLKNSPHHIRQTCIWNKALLSTITTHNIQWVQDGSMAKGLWRQTLALIVQFLELQTFLFESNWTLFLANPIFPDGLITSGASPIVAKSLLCRPTTKNGCPATGAFPYASMQCHVVWHFSDMTVVQSWTATKKIYEMLIILLHPFYS